MATISVKHYHSQMKGAKQIDGSTWGELIDVLDQCLVNGINPLPCTITRVGDTVTVTTTGQHGFNPYEVLSIDGADQTEYNGEWRVDTVTANNVLTFKIQTTPATPATGTMICKRAPLNFEKAFAGTQKAAYRSKNLLSKRSFLRVDHSPKQNNGFGDYDPSWAKWANVGIIENMLDIDTFQGAQAPFDPNNQDLNWKSTQTNQFGWFKWYTSRTDGYENSGVSPGIRNWSIIGDDRFFYLLISYANSWPGKATYAFGDIHSFKEGDVYATILVATDVIDNDYFSSNNDRSSRFRLGDQTGNVILKKHTQIGGYTGFKCHVLWMPAINESYRISSGCNIATPKPNGADNSIIMADIYISESDHTLRGILPGIKWLCQNKPYTDMAIVENIQGEPGKKYFAPFVQGSTDVGQYAFDITGDWR